MVSPKKYKSIQAEFGQAYKGLGRGEGECQLHALAL
jgi:hypothetical protein